MTEVQLVGALLEGACRGIGNRVAALRDDGSGDAAARAMRGRLVDTLEDCAADVASADFAALVHASLVDPSLVDPSLVDASLAPALPEAA